MKPTDPGDAIEISVAGILAKLPENLKDKVTSDAGTIAVSKKQALHQLPSGTVKLAFAELRSLAPQVFKPAGDLEQTQIELPLSEVIQKLSGKGFSRRTDQKVINIPDEVAGLFGPKGGPVSAPKTEVIGMAPVEQSQPKPAAPAPAPKPAPAPAPKPAPAPVAAPKPAPAPAPVPKPAPAPAAPEAPLQVSSNLLKQMSDAAGKQAAPPAPAPAAPAGMVPIPVASVSDNWPDAIKQEIAKLNLGGGHFIVPVEDLGRGLKVGKVSFAWKQILAWTNPSLATQQGDTALDLPLKVVAPLYLAASKPSTSQKKVVIDPNIPDLFGGKQAASSAQPTATAPAPAPVPAPAPTPVPTPTAPAKPAPVSSPNDAVQRACKLAGVAGAIVTSDDGLSVAAQLPAGLKADNVAAFVPQLFGRMTQYAQDLGAGQVRQISFVCDKTTWQIGKAGSVYLAVVSKPGAPVPTAEVEALAQALAK